MDDLTPAFTHDGLTIILGGPIGVYETEDYPFLKDEIAYLNNAWQQINLHLVFA